MVACLGRSVVICVESVVQSQSEKVVGEMEPPAIQGKGLRKTYRVGEITVKALDGVDISLHPGEIVMLLPEAPDEIVVDSSAAKRCGWVMSVRSSRGTVARR
jgi:hypothetical protein